MTMSVEDDFRQAHTVKNLRARAMGWITGIAKPGSNTEEDAEEIEAIVEAYEERKEEIEE
mgnify:CR=1 FL=1